MSSKRSVAQFGRALALGARCRMAALLIGMEKISFDCDHINGIKYDHRLENLRILCPNCHSQTDSYRGRNKSKAHVAEWHTQLT